MRNGRTFPYRLRRARARAVTRKGTRSGVLDVPVKARRPRARQVRPPLSRDARRSPWGEAADPMPPRKTARASAAGARTKTDTGGRVEHTKAIGGTVVKELGIMAP